VDSSPICDFASAKMGMNWPNSACVCSSPDNGFLEDSCAVEGSGDAGDGTGIESWAVVDFFVLELHHQDMARF
jgi:hypothetical protein